MNVGLILDGDTTEALQASSLINRLATLGEIAVIHSSEAEPALKLLPRVNRHFLCPGLNATIPTVTTLGKLWKLLRTERFDLVVSTSSKSWIRVAMYWSGCGNRITPAKSLSQSLPGSYRRFRGLESNSAIVGNKVDSWNQMADELGLPPIKAQLGYKPNPRSRTLVKTALVKHGFTDGAPIVAIAPGGAWGDSDPAYSSIVWLPARTAHLANHLHLKYAAWVIILGSPTDQLAIERMKDDLFAPYLDMSKELSLSAAAAILERCDLLIAPDCPLLHIAAVTKTPTIGLFALTKGQQRDPIGEKHHFIQSKDDRMSSILVQDVLDTIEKNDLVGSRSTEQMGTVLPQAREII